MNTYRWEIAITTEAENEEIAEVRIVSALQALINQQDCEISWGKIEEIEEI